MADDESIQLEDILQGQARTPVAGATVPVVAATPFVRRDRDMYTKNSSGGMEEQNSNSIVNETKVGARTKTVMFSHIPEGSSRRQNREDRSIGYSALLSSNTADAESWRLVQPSRYVGDEGVLGTSTLLFTAATAPCQRRTLKDLSPQTSEWP